MCLIDGLSQPYPTILFSSFLNVVLKILMMSIMAIIPSLMTLQMMTFPDFPDDFTSIVSVETESSGCVFYQQLNQRLNHSVPS